MSFENQQGFLDQKQLELQEGIHQIKAQLDKIDQQRSPLNAEYHTLQIQLYQISKQLRALENQRDQATVELKRMQNTLQSIPTEKNYLRAAHRERERIANLVEAFEASDDVVVQGVSRVLRDVVIDDEKSLQIPELQERSDPRSLLDRFDKSRIKVSSDKYNYCTIGLTKEGVTVFYHPQQKSREKEGILAALDFIEKTPGVGNIPEILGIDVSVIGESIITSPFVFNYKKTSERKRLIGITPLWMGEELMPSIDRVSTILAQGEITVPQHHKVEI